MLTKTVTAVMIVCAVIVVAFTLFTGGTRPEDPAIQRALILAFTLPAVFLGVPASRHLNRRVDQILGLIFCLANFAVCGWIVDNYIRIFSSPFLDPIDVVFGVIGTIVVLEATRRVVGMAVVIVLLIALAYALWGNHVPFDIIRTQGMGVGELTSGIFFSTDGVFGQPIGIAATLIAAIVLLSSFLSVTGGSELFMEAAKSIAGGFAGGPAKIAVLSSALFGIISGSTAANAATCGSITVPLMKRAGYTPVVAAAIEALSSCGGQIMPPVMGAAAFLMVDYINQPYTEVMRHAVIPALLFFFSVFVVVHLHAKKYDLKPVPREEIPAIGQVLRTRGHMLVPIVLLVVMLALRYSIMYSAFAATVCALAVSFLHKSTRPKVSTLLDVPADMLKALAPLVAICAGAGILIGVLTSTGLNLKLTYLIDIAGAGNLALTLFLTMVACLILGMGLPTVAAYLVLATLIPTSLVHLGIPLISAHFFIFYFAVLSAITPPVAIAAYVTAGIANTDPVKVGITAVRLGFVAFLLPYAFAYSPSLLMVGGWFDVLSHVVEAIIGIMIWGMGVIGYARRPLVLWERLLLFAAGILLIWPSHWMSLVGVILAAVTVSARLVFTGKTSSRTLQELL